MAGRGKYFELLDFPKFAFPSVIGMDAAQTAGNLIDRLAGKSFMSYSMIWSRLEPIVAGHATESFIISGFNRYEDDWKNESLQGVARLLKAYFGGRGRWYRHPPRPTKVLGFWFKPSIKGVWWVDGNPPKQGPEFSELLELEDFGIVVRATIQNLHTGSRAGFPNN
jgi:hypothetical protein